jgi:ParB-like chromosome segregation protein Spo0J
VKAKGDLPRARKASQRLPELPKDFTLDVEVRDNLSKDDSLRIATVENLQRQNMTPLEETAAPSGVPYVMKA